MIRKRVKSSSIAAVGYDAATETLEVEFGHGDIYQYRNVAPRIFRALMNAPSKGRFLNARIRDAYPFARRERGEDDTPAPPAGYRSGARRMRLPPRRMH